MIYETFSVSRRKRNQKIEVIVVLTIFEFSRCKSGLGNKTMSLWIFR